MLALKLEVALVEQPVKVLKSIPLILRTSFKHLDIVPVNTAYVSWLKLIEAVF